MHKNLKYIILILAFFPTVVVSVVFAQEDKSTSSNGATANAYEENLRRWQSMSEEQREAIRQKVHALDSRQRETILENAKQFKQLPKEERSRIQGNFEKFKELPKEKKDLLRERGRRFEGLSPEQRAEMRRGIREKRGGPGKGLEKPRGPHGGPGAGPNQGKGHNPLGPRGGPGKNWDNPKGPQGGPHVGPGKKLGMGQGPGGRGPGGGRGRRK